MDKRSLAPSRRPRFGVSKLLGCLLLTATGCATTIYEPRPSAFIAIRADGKFVRDGKATMLEGAVAGDPAAEAEVAHARKHGGRARGYMIGGTATMLTGVIAAAALGQAPLTSARLAVGISSIAGVVIGGGLLIAGAVEDIYAVKHAIVAVDVYNDRVLRTACALPAATTHAPQAAPSTP
jgi:hypothetical protein